jgi:hypothetical protein
MGSKTIKRIVILLIIFIPFIYFGLWLFIDLPPKVNPNIDYFKTNQLKALSDEEINKMCKAYEGSSFFEKLLFRKYLNARDEAILNYCLDNGLRDNIGGGCYHLVGAYNSNDTYYALKYSRINWK